MVKRVLRDRVRQYRANPDFMFENNTGMSYPHSNSSGPPETDNFDPLVKDDQTMPADRISPATQS